MPLVETVGAVGGGGACAGVGGSAGGGGVTAGEVDGSVEDVGGDPGGVDGAGGEGCVGVSEAAGGVSVGVRPPVAEGAGPWGARSAKPGGSGPGGKFVGPVDVSDGGSQGARYRSVGRAPVSASAASASTPTPTSAP